MTASSRSQVNSPRLLWFFTPMRLSLILVAAVAILTAAFILFPRASGDPSPAVSSSPGASASAEPSTTPEPTDAPTATPAPTPEPTPTPIAQWTGLVWTDPVTPSFTVHLDDLVPWRDGYVAVGMVETANGPAARILSSPDGVNWTVAFDPGSDHWPRHLAVLGDELLAFSQRTTPVLRPGQVVGAPPDSFIWRSTDGEHWSLPQTWPTWSSESVGQLPAGWDETQYPITTALVDVAGGSAGLVAIGNSFADGELVPIVMHSTDGQTWSRISLPADSVSALLNQVATYDGGFVLVGATGVGADTSTAMPAAWFSADGVEWTSANVEGDDATSGGELGTVNVGADGLVACYGPREMLVGGRRFSAPWFSQDGESWRGPSQADPSQACGPMAYDGVRIVALPNTFHADTGQWSPIDTAWVSTDGVTWIELTMSRSLSDPIERFWVVPDGVIYAGEQAFWFAEPTVAP